MHKGVRATLWSLGWLVSLGMTGCSSPLAGVETSFPDAPPTTSANASPAPAARAETPTTTPTRHPDQDLVDKAAIPWKGASSLHFQNVIVVENAWEKATLVREWDIAPGRTWQAVTTCTGTCSQKGTSGYQTQDMFVDGILYEKDTRWTDHRQGKWVSERLVNNDLRFDQFSLEHLDVFVATRSKTVSDGLVEVRGTAPATVTITPDDNLVSIHVDGAEISLEDELAKKSADVVRYSKGTWILSRLDAPVTVTAPPSEQTVQGHIVGNE